MIINTEILKKIVNEHKTVFLTISFFFKKKKKNQHFEKIDSESLLYISNGFSLIYNCLKNRKNIKFFILKFKEDANSSYLYKKMLENKIELLDDFDEEILKEINVFNTEFLIISFMNFYYTIPILELLKNRLNKNIKFIIGGPGINYFLSNMSITLNQYLLNYNNYHRILIYTEELFNIIDNYKYDYSLYFENNLKLKNNIKLIKATLSTNLYCIKKEKHNSCAYCEFETLTHLSEKSFRFKFKDIINNLKVNLDRKNKDIYLQLTLSESGIYLSYLLFLKSKIINNLKNNNVYLSANTCFYRNKNILKNLLKNYKNILEYPSILGYGLETMIDSIRKEINKDYVLTKDCLDQIIFLNKNTNFFIRINLILNFRPISDKELSEFLNNLNYLLNNITNKENIVFIIITNCRYYNLNYAISRNCFYSKDKIFYKEEPCFSYSLSKNVIKLIKFLKVLSNEYKMIFSDKNLNENL